MTGPGISTFYAVGTDGAALAAAVWDFFTSIKDEFPIGVTWTRPTGGETVDDNTGEINGTWTGGTGGTLSGTDSGPFARGVGMRIVWETAGVTGGRRVRGSTFLVPLGASRYQSDGSIIDARVTNVLTAGNALVTAMAGALVILTRNTPAHSGTSHEVTSVTVPDKTTWLTTRRD